MKSWSVILILIALAGCGKNAEYSEQERKEYQKEVDEWHRQRELFLKYEEGWLNLAGLFWLEPGINTIGSGNHNDIQFPSGALPELAGYLLLENGKVSVRFSKNARVRINDSLKTEGILFTEGLEKQVVSFGSFRWNIIQREDQYGIRLRDLQHPRLEDFNGIERFPVNLDYKIKGKFRAVDTIRRIPIQNVLGQTLYQLSPGTLEFKFKGMNYALDVIDEENGGDYFVVFSDGTTSHSTYSGGRFLYVPRPDQQGKVTIDFNKAINPPCVFSPFATCPLPPKQNHLSISIEAGEKNFHLD